MAASNFTFLESEFPFLYEIAEEAERYCLSIPRHAANLCRISLEAAVKWMYDNDPDLSVPYDKSLFSLLKEPSFEAVVPYLTREKVHFIRKLGNNADHSNRKINGNETLQSVKCLYFFLQHFARLYAEQDFKPALFDETLVPADKKPSESKKELEQLKEKYEAKIKEIERLKILHSENEHQIQLLHQREAHVKQLKEKHKDREPVPDDPNEAATRRFYIDLLIKEAGWDLEEQKVLEYPVEGMPKETNPSGKGFADYVLWGDDGLPLAVIEAKKTLVDSHQGQRQAELYADCLEKMTGQRPVIFYTNGYETHIWDDLNYGPRLVHGIYTKEELQTLVNRRKSRKDLNLINPNKKIAGRFYQIEAVKRVIDAFQNEYRRKALIVMATGTGKTRLATSLAELFAKANWIKRVLFLADRNALVNQGKNKFGEFLIDLPMVDITKDKENANSRIVFSTYPTMMNLIDGRSSNGEKFYSVGHFDLIIIDEAHRSVYNKYQAIFDYYDALMIGLTATPKADVDHNTYELFDLSDGNPTYAYELDQAIADKFLVPPKAFEVPIKFPREGIKYKDLSKQEKKKYEETFLDEETGNMPDEIGSEALNKWLFNSGTVDVVITHLMENGIKVEGGDKLGKTIIFAKNHKHALFIQERFNALYPQYKGKFLRVIDYHDSKAASTLADFSEPQKMPQIAVSVDMLDTGIDIPEIVNLVFLKRVRSSSKFWQMIGRGTRKSENLFSPGKDKKEFYIFDFGENFEFFDVNPDGVSTGKIESVSQKIFKLKLRVAEALKEEQDLENESLQNLRKQYLDDLHQLIINLNRENFSVRKELRYVDQFKNREVWDDLSKSDVATIWQHLFYLPVITDNDEFSKRFDLLIHNLQVARLEKLPAEESYINNIIIIANGLSKKFNIPVVKLKQPLINRLKEEPFWKESGPADFEFIRKELRNIASYGRDKKSQEAIYSNLKDEISGEVKERDIIYNGYTQQQSYKLRVEKYLREHKDNLAIRRIRSGEVLTKPELESLEELMFKGGALGTKEEFQKEFGTEQPLTYFIRSILGFDKEAANKAFGDFLQRGNLHADQITFIKNIIDHLTINGIIDKGMLFEPPFTDLNDDGAFGLFPEEEAMKIFSIVDKLNEGVG
jgi:type I restriction enzyme R subunit